MANYIEEVYDTQSIKRIYLSGDGANWIKGGAGWLKNCIYVVDKFHLSKYVRLAGGHVDGAVDELWDSIKNYDKEYFNVVIDTIIGATESKSKISDVMIAKRFINNIWETLKYHREPDYIGCSAEGHISHVLSARLSSRPLGWSEKGADQMTRLRVFRENGGNIHQLMLQKKDHHKFEITVANKDAKIRIAREKAAGAELQHNLIAINMGKSTSLNLALRSIRGLI